MAENFSSDNDNLGSDIIYAIPPHVDYGGRQSRIPSTPVGALRPVILLASLVLVDFGSTVLDL